MKTIVSTKNISLDRPLEIFIDEKMGSLEKFVNDDNAVVRLEVGIPSRRHRSGPVFRAEANLKLGKELLRSESTNVDLRTAIVEVKDELQILIKKFKGKRTDLARQPKNK